MLCWGLPQAVNKSQGDTSVQILNPLQQQQKRVLTFHRQVGNVLLCKMIWSLILLLFYLYKSYLVQ